jgi:hypothetical protein
MLPCMTDTQTPGPSEGSQLGVDARSNMERDLANLANKYGPLDVALAASELTDKAAIVHQWRANGDDLPQILRVPIEQQRVSTPSGRCAPVVPQYETLIGTGPMDEVARVGKTTAPRYADVEADYEPPPMQCCAELEEALRHLDSWITTFIGRMQPYSKNLDAPVPMAMYARSLDVGEDRSPLENRILRNRDIVFELLHVLDNMNTKLAL